MKKFVAFVAIILAFGILVGCDTANNVSATEKDTQLVTQPSSEFIADSSEYSSTESSVEPSSVEPITEPSTTQEVETTISLHYEDEESLKHLISKLVETGNDVLLQEVLETAYGSGIEIKRLPASYYYYEDTNIKFLSDGYFTVQAEKPVTFGSDYLTPHGYEWIYKYSDYPIIYDWFIVDKTIYIIDRTTAEFIFSVLDSDADASKKAEKINQELGTSIEKAVDLGEYSIYKTGDLRFSYLRSFKINVSENKQNEVIHEQESREHYFWIFTNKEGDQILVFETPNNQTHEKELDLLGDDN